jgi:hypothetical protein
MEVRNLKGTLINLPQGKKMFSENYRHNYFFLFGSGILITGPVQDCHILVIGLFQA